MKVIGLTGGIASGKSTVGRLLASWGVPVIDADQLSRQAVLPGSPTLARIGQRWPQVICADGSLDRAALGAVVFADAAQRAELTAIVIPRIVELMLEERARLQQRGARLCVFEAAVLFEEGWQGLVDGVLLVSAPPQVQIERLVARNGYTDQQARQRLNAQLPLEEKVRRSRWVLDNSGTEAELEQQLRRLWERIETEA